MPVFSLFSISILKGIKIHRIKSECGVKKDDIAHKTRSFCGTLHKKDNNKLESNASAGAFGATTRLRMRIALQLSPQIFKLTCLVEVCDDGTNFPFGYKTSTVSV